MNLSAAVLSSLPTRREPEPVAVSLAMQEVLAAVRDVAPTSTTVLLLGESGTGKEVIARTIHRRSSRCEGPYVAVNCAALPADLLESELFGHERGAFTGAAERRAGRVELADKGTLLLDEISEMPLSLQAKLLRVLQEREVDRVGGQRPIQVDIRVIATSNRDLASMVSAGAFRADLFYRLNVFPIRLPSLRERPEDLPSLCSHLVAEAAEQLGLPPPQLTEAALDALRAERLPGNVRELANLLERAIIRCRGPVLDAVHLGLKPISVLSSAVAQASMVNVIADVHGAAQGTAQTYAVHAASSLPGEQAVAAPSEQVGFPQGLPLDLNILERMAIDEALRRTNGNRTHAARILGIGLRTLRNKLRQWRLAEISSTGLLNGGQLMSCASDGCGSNPADEACACDEERPAHSSRGAIA